MSADAATSVQVPEPGSSMVVDSVLLFSKSVLAALTGAVFWVVAARLQSPEVIGVAGSLVAAGVALSFFSLLGLNYALVKLLPTSPAPAADVVTSGAIAGMTGLVVGCGYALVASHLTPSLAFLGRHVGMTLGFAVLVAGWTVSLVMDAAFLALRWVPVNLVTNGLLAGLLRCLLPFGLVGLGAFGLFVSMGLAVTVAALAGLLVLTRRLPRPRRWARKPSGLGDLARFAGAGYVTSVLDMIPQMLLPLIVVSTQGAYEGGLFYVAFQVASLLYALVMSVVMSMFAEGTRHPDRADAISHRAGALLAASVTVGVVTMVALGGLLLSIFGSEYVPEASTLLPVLAAAAVPFAFNNWVLTRQRIEHLLRGSVVMQAVTCAAVLGGAVLGARAGVIWVAAAWGLGQLLGGVVGYVEVRHHLRQRASTAVPVGLPVLNSEVAS